MSIKRKSLANNTIMLYLLTGSNYLFGLVTVPYLTRVLELEAYGVIGFATAFSTVMQMILDFGFRLSATLEVAKNQDDLAAVARITSAVTAGKMIMATFLLVVVLALCAGVSVFSDDPFLYLLYFGYALCNSLMPDFLYRGLENMTTITVRNVAIKLFFVLCVFVFVKSPDDYLLVPLFYLLGSIGGILAVYNHMVHVLTVRLVRVGFSDIIEQWKKALFFFLSRIASTVFTSLNVFVLRFLYPTGPVVGLYTARNQVIHAGRNAITPVTGSLFPHIVRTKNFALLFRVAAIGEVILISGSIIVGIYADPICILFFGESFAGAAVILRLMLPLIPITLLSYLFGWSALGALGLERYTNYSVFAGALFQVIALLVLYFANALTVESLCVITVFAELAVLLIRVVVMVKGLKSQSHKGT